MEEDIAKAQFAAVTDGATDDSAQHIATPFIARQDTVGHEKTTGANVIGQDAQTRICRWIGTIDLARDV